MGTPVISALVLTQENWGLGADGQVLFAFPKPAPPFPLSMSTPALQIAVTFAIVLGVIIYRISTAAALAMNSSPSVRSNIRVTVTATAVIINLVVIILLDEVYGCIARWLTKIGECHVQDSRGSMGLVQGHGVLLQLPLAWPGREWLAASTVITVCLSSEVPKTEKSFEERLTFKAFLLKFVNSYTPIFYVAFFKGR